MTQPWNLISKRIRNVKNSLDNAEQSFLDNKDIRGELDLMLAEAELKNLRRKKNVPWSWNRQLLAICSALLLLLTGIGGWYMGKDYYESLSSEQYSAEVEVKPRESQPIITEPKIDVQHETQDNAVLPPQQAVSDSAVISKSDLHKLVQSARLELSNSK